MSSFSLVLLKIRKNMIRYSCLIGEYQQNRGNNVPTLFFRRLFAMKKGVWSSKISRLFLINYKISESQICFCFFIVFLDDLECAGTLFPACTQATFKSPPPNRVMYLFREVSKNFFWFSLILKSFD